MRTIAILFLICAAQLVGQVEDSNSITVTVSKNLSLPPDQVTLDIQVSSDLTATLDDAQALLRSVGITGAAFRSISSSGRLTFFANANRSGAASVTPVSTLLFSFLTSPPLAWRFELTEPISKLQDTIAAINKLSKPGAAGKSLSATLLASSSFANDAAVADARRKALPDLIAAAQQKAKSTADAAGLTLGPILAFSEGPDLSLTVKFALQRFNSVQ
jgi:hypothetical protein